MVTKNATTFTYDTPDVKRINTEGKDGSYNFKLYEKKDGKLKPIGRRKYDAKTKIYKDVTQFSNGTSRTVRVNKNYGITSIVIRDKKENIIDKTIYGENIAKPSYCPEPSKSEAGHKVLVDWSNYHGESPKKAKEKHRISTTDLIWWNNYILDQARLMKHEPYEPISAYLIDTFGGSDILEKVGFTKEEAKLLLKSDRYDLKEIIRSIKDGTYTSKNARRALNKAIKEQGDKLNICSALKKAINSIKTQIEKMNKAKNTENYFTQVQNHTVEPKHTVHV